MLVIYVSICLFFLLVSWKTIKIMKKYNFPNNNSNDDEGGTLGSHDFPIIDIPPGAKLEDILVDKWYDDVIIRPNQDKD